jgi:NAD(P)-dependent dehydrogenase (short-subunit alcohol dehydrogenase family)
MSIPSLDATGKVVIVTGASKGLGRAMALGFAEAGADVVVASRKLGPCEAVADEVRAMGRRALAVSCHVGDWDQCAALVDATVAEFGRIDVLINNAGITGPHRDAIDLTSADALGVFDVNLFGVIRATAAFVPLLRRSADPVIINVSSGMGSLAFTHDPSRVESTIIAPLYTASKAALTMLTTQYAKAFPDIRINAVDPGYTATDLNAHSGPQTVIEGTDAIVGLATEQPGAGSGRFVDRFGEIALS